MMKIIFTLLLVLAGALLSVTPPASAEERPGSYVALKGGVYSPSASFDLNNFNNGTATHLDSKTGFDGEIAFGHYLLPNLALELGAGYFESKGSPVAPPGETTLQVVPVVLSGKLFIPLGSIEPYGEVGIGAYFTKLDVQGNLGSFSGSSTVSYAPHVGAGINFDVSDFTFLGIEGRYLWVKPSLGGQDINLNGFTLTANLGFRF
ncbi:MAG: outer membrane beta-barrel protein [Nitrospiria bacterium]